MNTTDPFQAVNDPEFLARLRGGSGDAKKAFNILVQKTHGRLLAYVRRHLSPVEECQEVVQETYLGVHQGLSRFEGKSKLTTWIYTLAHHKICDRLSQKTRWGRERVESLDEFLTTEHAPQMLSELSIWDGIPDVLMARDATVALMENAIAALPSHFRAIYQLRDIEGLSGDDAAAALGISAANARLQLHRARKFIVEWTLEKTGRTDILDMIEDPELPLKRKEGMAP